MNVRTPFFSSFAQCKQDLRRFLIRRQLAAIQYHIAHIKNERAHDLEVERIQHIRQAILLSNLAKLEK